MLTLKGKTDAVVEWAKKWDGFDGYLKLNSIVAEEGESTIVTDATDREVDKYIDGTANRQYQFNLRIVLPWSSGFDKTNSNSMEVAVMLYDWAESKNEARDYPDWEGALIVDLIPTLSMPRVNFVYEEDGLAEYLIPFIINYEE